MGIFLTPERYEQSLERIRSLMPKGRAEPMKRSLYAWTCIAKTDGEARDQASALLGAFYNLPFERLERFAIVGSPKTCAARLQEFVSAGVEDFAIAPITAGRDMQTFDLLVGEVIPSVTA